MPTKRRNTKARLLEMAELCARPCTVDGRPALFHRWIEDDRALLRVDGLLNAKAVMSATHKFRQDGVVLPGFTVDVLRETFALVEYRDGTVAKVKPELVRFDVEGD